MAGQKLKVLLVDNDRDFLSSAVQVLESCSYIVTAVDDASTALAIFSKGPLQFDLFLTAMSLNKMEGLTLLHIAQKFGLQTMLMTSKLDRSDIETVLSDGALLLLEKPLIKESAKYISQIVTRQKYLRNNHNICPLNVPGLTAARHEQKYPNYKLVDGRSKGSHQKRKSSSCGLNSVQKKLHIPMEDMSKIDPLACSSSKPNVQESSSKFVNMLPNADDHISDFAAEVVAWLNCDDSANLNASSDFPNQFCVGPNEHVPLQLAGKSNRFGGQSSPFVPEKSN